MQDRGIIAVCSKDQCGTESTSSSASTGHSRNSAPALPENAGVGFDRIDDNTVDMKSSAASSTAEAKLLKSQDLPENISSNFENVSLDDADKNLGYGETRCAEKGESTLGWSMEIMENLPAEVVTAVEDREETANVRDGNVGSPLVQNDPRNGGGSGNNGASQETIEKPALEIREPRGADNFENKKQRGQQSVCENPKERKHNWEDRPTLSDDGRLVKISLPTGPINIMQTNAQLLNKSRNFLNFITEKSTNIMEKTLLPQNLTLRYNTILRMSEPSLAVEKKSLQVAPVVETRSPSVQISNSQVDTNLDVESCREQEEKPSNEENCTKSVSPKNIDDFGTTTKPNPLALTNEETKDSASISTKEEGGKESIIGKFEKEGEDVSSVLEGRITGDPGPTESSLSLLKHPVYLTLVRDYAKAREEKVKLEERIESLEAKNRTLEAERNSELFNVQLETLEKTVERLSADLRAANANQDELGREYTAANKERESMVMKYAVSEKQLIDTQRARDYAERRHKEIAKEYELLQSKLRQGQGERTRICNILDTKCREVTELQKEVERLKEDVNVREVKLKWTQTKLKTEMEGNKETQQKLDKATARINDMREECEQIRRESQQMIRQFQHSEENKAVTLDQQLKEQQARLILERHVTEDKEILRLQLQKEVEQLKNRQIALIEENNTLSLKIQDLEKNRLTYEGKLSELKTLADQRQKEIVDLSSKVSHLETLKLQLIHKEQCLMSNEAEVERLRQVNQELEADMECCRQREAHMLDFTQKLTDKNVRLQSEFTSIEAKSTQLEQEQGPLRESIVQYQAKIRALEESLDHEKKKRIEECEILARHLAEQTQIVQNLTQQLEESQGEIAVLKRKQQISVKEMSRELQQCRKKLEAYERAAAAVTVVPSSANSLEPTSRAGSNNSLNAGEGSNGTGSDNSGNGDSTRQTAELDRQSLIDRILKMQKINVRRAEKLDFLEEHTRTLVSELQKKTKIIQNYILHENFDAMGSNERDRHKAELARYGGIMASVYSQRVSDDNMTLELSLEINQKLQAVLEDALLKNITLKDNIDTLGEEIARLTIKNQQLLQQKGK